MLSLVIATLGDDGCLRECLRSLEQQVDAPPFEVIIVDQNSDGRVASIVPEFAQTLSIKHVTVPFRGASRARNHGASIAEGEWIGFPDDDCELRPDTLAQFAQVLAANPYGKIITGRTVDRDGVSNVLRWGTEATAINTTTMFSSVSEATMFIEAKAYASVGGFDERFGPGGRYPAAEGLEMINRLLLAHGNGCGYYSPAIVMAHPTKIPPFNAWAVGRYHSYAMGDGAFIAKSRTMPLARWGARTLASSAIQSFSLPPWRGLAYAARLAGLVRGFCRYYLDALRTR